MYRKIIYLRIVLLLISVALMAAGIILAGPVVFGLVGTFIAKSNLSGWKWDYDGLGKVLAGCLIGITGFLMFLMTLLRRRIVFWLSLFVVVVLTAYFSGYLAYRYVMDTDKISDQLPEIVISQDEEILLEIPYNSNTTTIADLLHQKGIIKSTFIFKLLSRINGYDGLYQSGVHRLKAGLGYDEIMRILSGKPLTVRVTIPEGYTYKQIVDLFESKKLIDREEFNRIANTEDFDYPFLKDLPKGENRLEGYLFPDTYEFGMNATEKEIIVKMLDNFNRKFKYPEFYKKAEDLGLTVHQVITLASIVEREAQRHEERMTIAGIFYKRLNSKDPSLKKLQSCATIQYINFYEKGKYLDVITEQDTKVDHPYNTYEHEGLPPGPICSPGLDSIEAALYPEDTEYLFFVAKGDGTHHFSRTYSEHQAAMKKYGVSY